VAPESSKAEAAAECIFGATAKLCHDEGTERVVSIVCPDEGRSHQRPPSSWVSPMERALISPSGRTAWCCKRRAARMYRIVLEVWYERFSGTFRDHPGAESIGNGSRRDRGDDG